MNQRLQHATTTTGELYFFSSHKGGAQIVNWRIRSSLRMICKYVLVHEELYVTSYAIYQEIRPLPDIVPIYSTQVTRLLLPPTFRSNYLTVLVLVLVRFYVLL